MTRLNGTESQEYFKSLSTLINFYLVKIQLHLNTVKSADEIITHNMNLAMTSKEPMLFKPSAINDDEMNSMFLILEPESHEDDIHTTTETTTTEASTDSSGEVYTIDAHNITTNGDEFNFWDVYAHPKETTTKISIDKEALTTTQTIGKQKSPSSTSGEKNSSPGNSDENWLVNSFEENVDGLSGQSNEDIIELEDSITKEDRNNEQKIHCADGSCVDQNKQKVTTDQGTDSKDVRKDIDQNLVDQIIDFNSHEANVNQSSNSDVKKSSTIQYSDMTESSTIQYHIKTKQSPETTISNYNPTLIQEHTTLATEQDLENNLKMHLEEVNTKGNAVESEQSTDVVLNDLNKWNQYHENKEQNEILINKNPAKLNLTENIRHKKENRIQDNFEDTLLSTTTEHISRNTLEQRTPHLNHEKLDELISNMPTVPSEDPGHDNHQKERSDENLSEDSFIIKSEDLEIMERVHSENRKTETEESIMNEITEESNIVRETTTINGTNDNDELNRIQTEPTLNTNENQISNEENNLREITTKTTITTKYENHETTTNTEHRHRKYDLSESTGNNSGEKEETNNDNSTNSNENSLIDANSKESSVKSDESTTLTSIQIETTTKSPSKYPDPNQYVNKLVDELSTTQMNSYESREKTNNDKSENSYINENIYTNENSYTNKNKNEYNDPTMEEESNTSYGTDHVTDTNPHKETLDKSVDEDTINIEDPMLSNHYPIDSSNEKTDEDDLGAEAFGKNEGDKSTTTRQPSTFIENNEEIKRNNEKTNTEQTEKLTNEETTLTIIPTTPIGTIESIITSSYKESEINNEKNITGPVEKTTPMIPIEITTQIKNIETTITSSHKESEIEKNDNITLERMSEKNNTTPEEIMPSTTESSHDNDSIEHNYNRNIDASESGKNQSSENNEEDQLNVKIKDAKNESSLSVRSTESTQKQTEETKIENNTNKYKLSNKIQNLDDDLEVQTTAESQKNKLEGYLGETSTLLSLSGAEQTVKSIGFTTSKIPPNYKHADFKPLNLILKSPDQNMDVANKSAFIKMRTVPDEFVIYDVPDDVTPEDITQLEDANGKTYTKSRNNKNMLIESEDTLTSNGLTTTPTDTFVHTTKNPRIGKLLEFDYGLDVLDVLDEPVELETKIKGRANRRRRFVMNQDDKLNPTHMNITCEALNILSTITDDIAIENIIVKLNKDELLDCLDLINKINISKRAAQYIINKYYNSIHEVLPLMGNILADLTLEEIRSVNMNEWALEIMEHMNSINDTKKAGLIVEKYMKNVNRNVLNLNEMVILNNMLCYLPENVLKKSLVNIKPTEMINILKHINTCSTKCLSTFSSLAVEVLGSPMNWKYEQVYNLGTIPSGLNETMWNEFIQQKHLKFNINENNYKCFYANQLTSMNNAASEDNAKREDYEETLGTSQIQEDGYSSSSKIIHGCIGLIVNLYILLSFF